MTEKEQLHQGFGEGKNTEQSEEMSDIKIPAVKMKNAFPKKFPIYHRRTNCESIVYTTRPSAVEITDHTFFILPKSFL